MHINSATFRLRNVVLGGARSEVHQILLKCVTVLEELKIQAMNDGGIGTVQYLSRYGLFVDNLIPDSST